ncbi:FecR domain-containing protein [Pseudomonas sp. UL073]|uniref:FecR domain-containing protein n=1 Tax=Zestomonas insulae TaxID=2809017 RepID=A0ABS2II67_9GAMM|nr:FecR domain-containing protein [Pseudomonas insulae]MBM7062642.1 FecR domain-containing protein [Pseudomonas insulae]
MNHPAEAPIAAAIVEQASHWLMLQWGGELDGEQQRRFHEWQAADPEHRRAWQRLERLQGTLAGVPGATARTVLRELPDARRRQTLKLLGLLLMAGGSGYLAETQLPWRESLADLRSGTGERLRRTLPDGSRLVLNSGSAVNIRYSASERRIQLLGGELLLDSGKDPARRPLIVETAGGEIEALGTRFSVYALDAGSRVALYDGELELRPRDLPASRLQAGQQRWFAADRLGPLAVADLNAVAWSDERLVAERMPLGQFLAELARHRRGVLRCDPAVAGLSLTGVFPLADTDRVLAALQQSLPIRVERLTRYWVTVHPADAPSL